MHLIAAWSLVPTDQVLVTETADTAFSVISPLRRLADGRTLYKLFSAKTLGRGLLQAMFSNHELVRVDACNTQPCLKDCQGSSQGTR